MRLLLCHKRFLCMSFLLIYRDFYAIYLWFHDNLCEKLYKSFNGKFYSTACKRNCTPVSLLLPLLFFFVKFFMIHSKINQFCLGNFFEETVSLFKGVFFESFSRKQASCVFWVTGRKFKVLGQSTSNVTSNWFINW